MVVEYLPFKTTAESCKRGDMKQKTEWNNDRMAAEVKDAIDCLTTIPTESLLVRVRGQRVYLSGVLNDRHQKEFVGEVVRHLDGINGVTNLIAVEPDAMARN